MARCPQHLCRAVARAVECRLGRGLVTGSTPVWCTKLGKRVLPGRRQARKGPRVAAEGLREVNEESAADAPRGGQVLSGSRRAGLGESRELPGLCETALRSAALRCCA
jgi:hypothetical protein